MNIGPQLLLIGAVAAVGVLHTMVPDHWAPIALFARQRSWSKAETARAALLAGTGHVLFTLLIASAVWFAGVAVANRFGQFVEFRGEHRPGLFRRMDRDFGLARIAWTGRRWPDRWSPAQPSSWPTAS